jgi:hypothetical protein
MKKTTKVVLSIFAIAIASVLASEYSSQANGNNGTPPKNTCGSPADNNCSNCHGSATTSYTTSITSNIPSSGYISGQTYTVNVYVNAGTSKRFGFECSPQVNSGTRTIIGTVAAMGTDQVNGTGYISHNGGQVGTSYTWQFQWTAPGSSTQTAANATSNKANGFFYSSILIANNNGTNDGGDHPQQTNTAITENTAASIVITASATTICSGINVTFAATPTNGGGSPTYQWQLNGNKVGSNSTTYASSSLVNSDVITCILTSNKTGVTASPATSNSITMTVNTVPSITGHTDGSRCDAGSVTLAATSDIGTINWYAASSGGASLATGASFSTPSISSTTTYYVDATNNGCTTASRTAVTATVNNTPAVPSAGSNSPVCAGDNILLNSASSTSGVSYNWTGPNSFTSTIQNPPIASATQLMAGTYSVTASQNGCTSAAGTTTVIVNTPATPTASIAVTGSSNTTCSGQSITFSVTPTNGGSNPAYQWLVNNVAASGTNNSNTYTYNNFNNNDTVTCVLTSNASCLTTAIDTSNAIVITLTPKVAPSVSIAVTGGSNPGCFGQTVTFTASTTNGGSNPSYQWQLNGNNVGSNQNSYSNNAIANNDVVRCILTSNAVCLSTSVDTSAVITMAVNSSLVPSVSITTLSGSTTICEGLSVQFDATPTNGGSTPTYQWTLDGTIVGNDSASYTSSALTNGQKIACTMTSSSGCANPTAANSGTLTMVVTPTVPPTLTINGSNAICAGAAVTYTASASNQGLNANFDWRVNGVSVQSGSSWFFSPSNLSNNDAISCVLTPIAATCANPTTVSSNTITISVTPIVYPTATIEIIQGSNPNCIGQPLTFSVIATDTGTSPVYQWKINAINAGTGKDTLEAGSLFTNDTITCMLTSNAACASSSVVISNKIGMVVTSAFTPSLTISGATSICEGQSVTFTANPYGGGQTPSYQWQLDGSPVGTNSPTYSPVTLTNGQVITCTMTSGSSCANPTVAPSSNTLTMVITPTVAPSVSINGLNSICAGTVVTYTASAIGGGTSPIFQWKLNGNAVGTTDSVYTSSNTLSNNNVITCMFITNAACATSSTIAATPIIMSVTAIVNPTIQIIQTSANPECSANPASFQALANGGGTAPNYQWLVNGSAATGGTNSNLYTSSTSLNNNDLVTCMLTSNATCASSSTVNATPITMSVTTAVTPSVTIAASKTSINAGTSVTVTATSSYGGSNPTYQWKLDGLPVGSATNNNTYITSSLTNGQVISCVLTSDYSCITQATANSNTIAMTVTTTVLPALPTISQTVNNTSIDLSSSAANGNQWYYNGIAIAGATAQTYTATQNGVYYVIVTNNGSSLQSAPVGIAIPVTIAQNGNVLTSSSTSGNQWYLDGIAIPDSTGQTITAMQNGYYSLVVTINGVSSSSTVPVFINSFSSSPTTGITSITNNNTIKISPSPNDGNFKISFEVLANISYNLEIRDMLGQLVYNETLSNFSGTYDKQINISGYGKGVYLINLTSSANKTINKVVVY